MRVRVDDPELLSDLSATLVAQIDAVVTRIDDHELEVGLLGSQSQPFARFELEQRLSPWRRRHPSVRLEIVDE